MLYQVRVSILNDGVKQKHKSQAKIGTEGDRTGKTSPWKWKWKWKTSRNSYTRIQKIIDIKKENVKWRNAGHYIMNKN